MPDGSTLVAAKNALITVLQARTGLANVNVSYQSPMKASDLANTEGDLDAVWLEDADEHFDVQIIAALPVHWDEEYSFDVIVQVLRPESDGTQLDADQRAVAILGEVLGAVAADPTLGITNFPRCEVTGGSWKHNTGFLPSTGHGSRFELRLTVSARLQLS